MTMKIDTAFFINMWPLYLLLVALLALLGFTLFSPRKSTRNESDADRAWKRYAQKRVAKDQALEAALQARVAWRTAVREVSEAEQEWEKSQSAHDGDLAEKSIEDLEAEVAEQAAADRLARSRDGGDGPYRKRSR